MPACSGRQEGRQSAPSGEVVPRDPVVIIPDPYKVLQVDPSADDETIEAAYRRLAKRHHPDVAGPEGSAQMVQINLARETLRDPARRSAVDRARLRREATSAQAAAAEGRFRAAATARAEAERRTAPSSSPAGSSGWPFPGMAEGSAGGFGGSTRWGHAHGGGATDGNAGPPPGNPAGSLVTFGRYSGWTLGEIARVDVEYLEWLHRTPIGRQFASEIDVLLRQGGQRSGNTATQNAHGLFRRR